MKKIGKIIFTLFILINFSMFSQYPTNRIYINFDNKQDNLLIDKGGISIQADDNRKAIKISHKKEYNKIMKNMEFNTYGCPIYYITLKKGKELMQLYFIFYQNDESGSRIILNDIAFQKGTFCFDFLNRKLINENEGKEGYFSNNLGYNINNSVINNHKISNKIITEKKVDYYFLNDKKRPKKIAKILESLTPEYIKYLKIQYRIN